jgi:hypothetical protein
MATSSMGLNGNSFKLRKCIGLLYDLEAEFNQHKIWWNQGEFCPNEEDLSIL